MTNVSQGWLIPEPADNLATKPRERETQMFRLVFEKMFNHPTTWPWLDSSRDEFYSIFFINKMAANRLTDDHKLSYVSIHLPSSFDWLGSSRRMFTNYSLIKTWRDRSAEKKSALVQDKQTKDNSREQILTERI